MFGLSFIIAFSCLVALLDIFILKFMIYLSRFRATLGPRIDRWIQDGVWQLQRRAYEGEGYRGWTDLEADIPLTYETKLKDLPILWLPRKSPALHDPAINYGEMIDWTSTLAPSQQKHKTGTIQTVEPVQGGEDHGLGLLGHFRR